MIETGTATPAHHVVEADHLRQLLRHRAASVTVITAQGVDRPAGLTATTFTPVSLSPPLISFCVCRGSSSWPVIQAATYVAVHMLGVDQAGVARTFATRGIDRFASSAWRPGPHGVPLLDGALAWLVCHVTQRIAAGDHAVVLAEPIATRFADGEPLLYHNGRYSGLVRPMGGRADADRG